MATIDVRAVGRGNGIRTEVTGLQDLAGDAMVALPDLARAMSRELGARVDVRDDGVFSVVGHWSHCEICRVLYAALNI